MEILECSDCIKIKEVLDLYISQYKNQVVADLFSYYFFDEIIHIEDYDGFFKWYWKNDDIQSMDEVIDIFNAHYIYRRSDWENKDGNYGWPRLYIYKNVQVGKAGYNFEFRTIEQSRDRRTFCWLFSEVRYMKNEKIHQCIINDMPFFSVILTNKPGPDIKETTDFLRFMNLKDIEEQVLSIKKDIQNRSQYEYMKISSMGNSLRILLERALKFYNINFNEEYMNT